jgi:hypothetical protein
VRDCLLVATLSVLASVTLSVACSDNHVRTELVQTVPEPAGPNCAAGGVAIETGVDVNNDGVLEPNEVTSTTYVCSGTSLPRELVKIVPEPAGTNCANGGQAIESGLDTNGDGILEDSEVTSTSYVCAGADGKQTLVRIDPELAGTNCAAGGDAIHTGLDTNGDGILEDSEVTSTSYVCAGADGKQPLFRIDSEPPGTNCAAGGDAIHTGLDTNGDGILEDSEITATTYVCAGAPPPAELVKVVAEAPGANCANGGEAVETGLDTNGNGMLDASEVTATSYVCAGSDGKQPLIRLDPEPPGLPCTVGGTAVRVGFDTNGDGILEDSEVTATSYICTGGEQALIRVDAEPPGANCTSGGSAIHAGLDSNNDGILEDDEILTTTYLCTSGNVTPTVIDGSFTIHNSLDVATLDGVQTITGDLIIDAPGMTKIDVPTVQNIGGMLWMPGSATLTELSFANLASAGTVIIVGETTLQTLALPKLATISAPPIPSTDNQLTAQTIDVTSLISVQGSLDVSTENMSLSLASLTSVGGDLVLDFGAMTTLTLPSLVTCGKVWIDGSPTLTTLSLPAMTGGGISLSYNTSLTTIDAPVLQSGSLIADSDPVLGSLSSPALTNGSIEATGNSVLSSLDFPALQSGSIKIDNNPQLSALSLPAMTSASGIEVNQDAALQTLSLPVLQTVSGSLVVEQDPLVTALSFPELTSATNLMIASDGSLSTLSLDALVSCGLFLVQANGALASISAPNFTDIQGGSFYVDNDPQLPTCKVVALLAQISPPPYMSDTSGDSSSCPP